MRSAGVVKICEHQWVFLQVVVQSEKNVNNCYSLFRSRDVSEAEAR